MEKYVEDSSLPPRWRVARDHPIDNILHDISRDVCTRSMVCSLHQLSTFISQVKPKIVGDTITYEHWLMIVHEELNQFERNQVWDLVPKPK